ncbi:MAG: Holliday junction branch migration protein RuvA [Candidatus Omnitrophota bacterium]|nr:Holliday junction branch migration protein RuvA [Candidatus Omnitrophota bacterium]
MITRLRGILREQTETHVLLEVNGVSYEVLVPPSILRLLSERLGAQGELELVTFHYHHLEVGRGIPMLIGFLNEIEREFFARFISVSGVGPRAALKALTLPIPTIAQAIDEGDLSLLRSLPGIGEQRAKEIVAKLQGKVGKYALIQTKAMLPPAPDVQQAALEEEAVAILLQLEYKKPEAKQMVRAALERNPKVTTAEGLLNEVYRQQRLGAESRQPTALVGHEAR